MSFRAPARNELCSLRGVLTTKGSQRLPRFARNDKRLMTFERKKLGKLGEDIACELLRKSGYKILERNFSTKVGEIDIVAVENNELVLVEVKTRFPGQFSLPEEAVTPFKIHHIARAGEYYQLLHP